MNFNDMSKIKRYKLRFISSILWLIFNLYLVFGKHLIIKSEFFALLSILIPLYFIQMNFRVFRKLEAHRD